MKMLSNLYLISLVISFLGGVIIMLYVVLRLLKQKPNEDETNDKTKNIK